VIMVQDAAGAAGARLNPQVDSLIRAAQQGDQDAFEQLVRAYDQNVLRLAMNLLRSPEDARDVYQEAFLRVYRNLHAFRFDCSFSYLALPHRDQHLSRPVAEAEGTERGIGSGGDAGREHRPHGDLRRGCRRSQSGAGDVEPSTALPDRKRPGRSDPRERMVFELRHYQGLRLRNIGEMLGTTEEAAKNCLFRATQKMRVELGDFL